MDSNEVADLLLAVWVNDTPLDNDNRQTRVKQKCDSTHTEPSEQWQLRVFFALTVAPRRTRKTPRIRASCPDDTDGSRRRRYP